MEQFTAELAALGKELVGIIRDGLAAAPAVVSQVLAYEHVMLVYQIVLCVVLAVIFGVVGVVTVRHWNRIAHWEKAPDEETRDKLREAYVNNDEIPAFVISIFCSFAAFVAIAVLFLSEIPSLIKLNTAPALYLAEVVKRLF